MNKLRAYAVALFAMLLAPFMAHAESTAAVTAITGAQTDATAVVGALTAMGIAIWAGVFIYRKFFK